MLMILSPSKTLNSQHLNEPTPVDLPHFRKDSWELITKLREKSLEEIQSMMNLSDVLAEETYQKIKSYKKSFSGNTLFPAMYMFDGGVYTGLQASTIQEDKYPFVTDRLRILSGLYGVLRPFDKTQAYRLEMGSRLLTSRGTNLYHFWGEAITLHLKKDLTKLGKSSFLLNLASNEYFQSIKPSLLNRPVVDVEFKERDGGKLKFISYDAKKARGLLARYVIDNEIQHKDDLKSFNLEGYEWQKEQSDDAHFMFVRNKPIRQRNSFF